MPGFIKSVLIASSVAAGTVGSVAAIGTGFDVSFSGARQPAPDPGPSVVRMAPIAVHIGGWTLKTKKNEDRVVIVSIAIDVPNGDARNTVCRLMPRLVSAVNSEVSRNVLYQDTWKEALTGSLGQRLTVRFNRALGRTLINDVRLQAHASKGEAPPATCVDAV
jgi:flagellar basal body-associated protein FliL